MLKPNHLQELLESGINEEIALLNFHSLEGNTIYDYLCYSNGFERLNSGRLSSRWLNKYRHATKGGWWASGLDPLYDWENMEWGCFKPDCPKQYTLPNGKLKTIKYEHPPKTKTRAFFLKITITTWKKIAQKYAVAMPENIVFSDTGEALGFWAWVISHPKIPITICEGVKKAAALLSIDIVAVAIPGIWNGYRQPKDSFGNKIGLPSLIPDLEVICQKERKINFCFDQDNKQKTRQNVNNAISQTGNLFAKKGCLVWVIEWNSNYGKGIDDVLVGYGEILVKQLFSKSITLEIWKTSLYSRLDRTPDLVVSKSFLTEKFICSQTNQEKFIIPKELVIPKNTQSLFIKSPKATGKTEYLACLVEPFIREGRKVLLLTHRVQLGKALCDRLGIPYIEELRESETGQLLGYGLCHHSMHSKSGAKFDPQEWEAAIIIIDELVQVLWDILSSPLIEAHQIKILQNLKESLRIALSTGGMLVGCDADLNDWAIDYINQLIGFKVNQRLVVNEWRPISERKNWEIYNYEGKNPIKLVWKLIDHIKNGGQPFILCSSQEENSKWSTQNLEGFLNVIFPDRKILRIDSETIGDPTHPAYGCTSKLDQILKLYDIVLTSPTLETGVDIRRVKHFDAVFGIFWGVQTCDGVTQFLARYRNPVPRHIWINKVGLNKVGNGESSPKHLYRSLDKVTKDLIARLQNAGFDDELEDGFQSESLNAWAKRGALINLERKLYRQTILKKLEDEGHILIDAADTFEFNSEELDALQESLTSFKDSLYKTHREAVEAIGNPTDDEYQELKKKRARTKDELRKLEHGKLARRYQVQVTPDLVLKDDEGWHPKIKLHYHLTVGRKFVEVKDKNAASDHLTNGDGKVWRPTFIKRLIATKIAALERLGIPKLFNLPEIRVADVLPIIELGQKFEWDLKAVGISVNWKDKPMSVIKCLLHNLFGLKSVRLRREGGRGNQQWVYSAVAPDFEKDPEGNVILVDGQPISIPDEREEVFVQWLARDEAEMAKAEGNHKMYRSDTVVQHPIYIDDGEAELPLGCTTETQVKETEGNLPLESLAQSLGQCQTTAEIWTFVGDSSARLEQIRDAILFVENWSKRQWLIREWNEVMRASDCGELAA